MDGFWYRVLLIWCFYLFYKTDSLEIRIQKLEVGDRRQNDE